MRGLVVLVCSGLKVRFASRAHTGWRASSRQLAEHDHILPRQPHRHVARCQGRCAGDARASSAAHRQRACEAGAQHEKQRPAAREHQQALSPHRHRRQRPDGVARFQAQGGAGAAVAVGAGASGGAQQHRGRATYSDNNQQSRELSFAIDNFPTTRATAELALGLGFSRRSYKPSLVYAAILARSALI